MVSAISSNQYNYGYNVNYQELEVMRRLQSLGINPTGNLTTDRQILQKAEYAKRQNTLAVNNTQNLSNLEGTGFAFNDTLNSLGYTNSAQQNNTSAIAYNTQQLGATQIAELNKYRLGL